MKNILIVASVVLLLAIGGALYLYTQDSTDTYEKDPSEQETPVVDEAPVEVVEEVKPVENVVTPRGPKSVIGKSADGNDIVAYHFGDGDTELMFIGGIHGGYSWNTALVSFEMIDWLKKNPNVVPKNVTVTVIPVLNPDGLDKVTGTTGKFAASQVNNSTAIRTSGRFNDNEVDLNRNFDCEWKSVGTWRDQEVSGGDKPFSEPESQAIGTYVNANKPSAIVTWYSAAGGVYASNCKNGILPETLTLTNLYADASKYPAHEDFNYYEITGDMVNWFASKKIPAISVLLTSHDKTEWTKNQAGIEAVLKHYAK